MDLLLLAHLPSPVLERGLIPAAFDLDLRITLVSDRAREHLALARPTRAGRTCRVLACDVWNPLALIRLLEAHDLHPHGLLAADARLQACAALAAEHLRLPGPSWRAALLCDQRARLRSCLEPRAAAPARWIVNCAGEDAPALEPGAFPVVVQPLDCDHGAAGSLARDPDELRACLARIGAGHALVERHRPEALFALNLLGTADGMVVLGGHSIQLAADHARSKRRHGFLPRPPRAAEVLAQLQTLDLGLGRHQVEYAVAGPTTRITEIHNGLHDAEAELDLDARLGGTLFRAVLQVCLGRPVQPLARPIPAEPVAAAAAAG